MLIQSHIKRLRANLYFLWFCVFNSSTHSFSPHYFATSLTPLYLINDNRFCKCKLTLYEHGIIVGAKVLSQAPTQLKKAFNFTKLTVWIAIQGGLEPNSSLSKSQSTRLKTFSDCNKRYNIGHSQSNSVFIYL